MSQALPQFSRLTHEGTVPSFRLHSWKNFSEGLVGVSSANRPHAVARIREPTDREILRDALQAVADRHETVLSAVVEQDGKPHLAFQRDKPVEIEFVDLRGQGEDKAMEVAAECVWRPFDMRAGLMRAFLIQLAEDDYVFGVVLHHFICDGAGIGLFWRELRACHRALAAGGAPTNPGLQIQYADYLVGMQSWIDSEDGARQLDYWKDRLAAPPAPALAKAREDQAVFDGRERFEIDPATCEALHAVAREQKTSLFAVLLAAQFVLLARVTDRADQIITCVTAGRESPALQPVIGYLADKIHYRVDLSGQPSFADVVRLTWEAISAGARAQFVRSDFIAQALAEQGYEILSPGFNFTPGRPKIPRPPPPPAGVMTAQLSAWTPITVPAPGALSPPGPGVCHYWLELGEFDGQISGYFHHKAPFIPGLLDGFREVLARIVGRDEAPVADWG